jgi:PAS domain S-box-containing protein
MLLAHPRPDEVRSLARAERVEVATSVTAARAALDAAAPDVLVLHAELGELVAWLRRRGPLPCAVVVLAADRSAARTLLDDGAHDWVGASFLNEESLERAIESALVRHRLERALAERDVALRRATRGGRVGLWEWDADTGLTRWSDMMWALYGREASSDAWSAFEQGLHPDDRAQVLEAAQVSLRSGATEHRQRFRIVRPDGEVRWIETIAEVERDAAGQPTGMAGINLDVTDGVRAEEQLRASAEQLRLALEASATGLWTWHIASDAVTWSREVYALLGVERGVQPNGAFFFQLVHPDDRERVRATARAAIDSRTLYECELRVVRPDGRMLWVQDRGRAIYDAHGAPTRLVGTLTDISARKHAEEERRENEARLRVALAAGGMGVWSLSAETDAVHWDEGIEALTGLPWTPSARGSDFLGHVHPDDVAPARADIEGAFRRGGSYRHEYRFVRPDGRVVWLAGHATAIQDETGRTTHLTGVNFDVTARRTAEAQLRVSHDTFARLIESNPFGIYVVDADFRMRLVSEGAQKTFATVRPLIGRDFAEVLRVLWEEPFASEAIARFRHTLATGEPYVAPGTVERRADRRVTEAYDWRIERVALPDGRFGVVCYFYDLTERHALEAALRRSESFYRQTLESMPGMVFTSTPDGVCDYLSAPWVTFTGVPAAEQLGDRWLNVLHPDDRARAYAAWRAAVEERGEYDLEYRLRRADGAYEWFKVRGRAIRDPEGAIARWFGTAVSIDDLKRAEAAIASRERELRSLTDNCPDILLRIDRDLRHVFVNATVEAATGLRREDFIGKTNRELGMPVETCEQWEPVLRAVFEERRPQSMEFAFDTPGGRRVYAARCVPELGADGEVAYAVCVTRDVTEARAADAALRDAKALLQAVIDGSTAVIFAKDLDGRYFLTNRAFCELFGLNAEDCFGAIDEDIMDAETAGVVRANDRRVVETGARLVVEEAAVVGGRAVTYLSSKFPLRDERGDIYAVCGVSADVTDRKRMEEALRDADRRKDEFLATLAHELRNPLAPIRTGLHLMKLAPPGDPRLVGARDMMERQLGHLVRLVDDLLDVARVSRGKLELKRERVTLQAVVEHAVEASRAVVDVGRHTLRVDLPKESLWVDGDLTRLAQVLGNLLNNAAKYTPPGGHIDLVARADGDEVIVWVTDDGAGISPEMLPKVFEMFTQVDGTMHRAQGGLGIGLSLVDRLLRLHGGSISAESPGLGRGSTFTVRLPRVQAPRAEHGGGSSPERAPGRRVLVVDDNVDAAESLALLLEVLGHAARVAHDGPSALSEAAAHAPEVVFLDLGLPGMSGYEVARALRADQAFDGTVLVALTGWGAAEDKRRTAEAGFDLHLTKPVDARQVKEALGRPRVAASSLGARDA